MKTLAATLPVEPVMLVVVYLALRISARRHSKLGRRTHRGRSRRRRRRRKPVWALWRTSLGSNVNTKATTIDDRCDRRARHCDAGCRVSGYQRSGFEETADDLL
ncbi:hypothetical protein DFP72DRAFT_905387 [Ephemerocybe angulata]|uniref:Uncharacterized protein n=1 Tax=Ephemerocybe angulata TaxID=980116 RepID=A0A8H6HTW2_9AGAR|nr:hypothetical protein DFP72DRAFT_905387 [Tulosesus angulatus]